jgi:DeoR family fructose operon transcriptional repressor
LFISCDAADSESGFYTSDLRSVGSDQRLISIADRVVEVAESAKFGRKAFVRFATLNQVDTLVTDAGLSLADRKNLEELGIKVFLAEVE